LPNWTDPQEKRLACLIQDDENPGLYLMFNAGTETVDFELQPAPPGTRWHLAADTSQDWFADGEGPHLDNSTTYHLEAHSSAILVVRVSQDIHSPETS
jgi:glycogen operon protein